jgi:hypothetical protein
MRAQTKHCTNMELYNEKTLNRLLQEKGGGGGNAMQLGEIPGS